MDNEKRQALSVYRMVQAEETLTAAKMRLEYHLYKDCKMCIRDRNGPPRNGQIYGRKRD